MDADYCGHRLWWERAGTGPAVIVAHGGPGLGHGYMRLALAPLEDRFSIIYFDELGCGRSERPPALTGGMEGLADQIDAVRVASGNDRVAIVGHSFGAFAALDYSLRRPERVRALALVSGAPAFDYADTALERVKAILAPQVFERLSRALTTAATDDADFRATWNAILPAYLHRFDGRLVEAMDACAGYGAVALNHGFASRLPGWSVVDRLHALHVPTLIVTGRHDWVTPVDFGAERLATIPDATVEVFRESGHFPLLEEPERGRACLAGWLSAQLRGASGRARFSGDG